MSNCSIKVYAKSITTTSVRIVGQLVNNGATWGSNNDVCVTLNGVTHWMQVDINYGDVLWWYDYSVGPYTSDTTLSMSAYFNTDGFSYFDNDTAYGTVTIPAATTYNAPAEPTNVKVTPIGANSLQFSWSHVGTIDSGTTQRNLQGFKYSKDGTNWSTLTGTTNKTYSVNFSNLDLNKKYTFYVKAYGKDGESVSVSASGVTAPNAPTINQARISKVDNSYSLNLSYSFSDTPLSLNTSDFYLVLKLNGLNNMTATNITVDADYPITAQTLTLRGLKGTDSNIQLSQSTSGLTDDQTTSLNYILKTVWHYTYKNNPIYKELWDATLAVRNNGNDYSTAVTYSLGYDNLTQALANPKMCIRIPDKNLLRDSDLTSETHYWSQGDGLKITYETGYRLPSSEGGEGNMLRLNNTDNTTRGVAAYDSSDWTHEKGKTYTLAFWYYVSIKQTADQTLEICNGSSYQVVKTIQLPAEEQTWNRIQVTYTATESRELAFGVSAGAHVCIWHPVIKEGTEAEYYGCKKVKAIYIAVPDDYTFKDGITTYKMIKRGETISAS